MSDHRRAFLLWVIWFSAMAAFGPIMLLGFWVYIRCCGNGDLGFRPYGESPFPNAEKVTEKACPNVRPSPWLGFLRCGIHPGASPPVCFAAPPLDVFDCVERSLRSHPRINPSTQPADGACGSRSRAAAELALILLSGGKRMCSAFALLWALRCDDSTCSRRRPDSRPTSS